MRALVAIAVMLAAVPTGANAGNSAQAVTSPAAKPVCVKPQTGELRNPQRTTPRLACKTQRIVPWVVDPTPIFIL